MPVWIWDAHLHRFAALVENLELVTGPPWFAALWAVLIEVVADGLRASRTVVENQRYLVVEHVSGAAVQADSILAGSIPDNL